MSKKPNPAVIGWFVISGLVLGIGGLLLFSTTKFFTKSEKYILYFDTSVRGLNPGAPVKYRGVTVGSVVEVLIRRNQRAADVHIPVIITVDESLVRKKTDRTIDFSDDAAFEALVQKGMRGILQSQSLLTGVLYVELDVIPNSPAPRLHQIGKEFKEIPTVPTQFEALFDRLSEIDLKRVVDQFSSVLAHLELRLRELKMTEISEGATNLLGTLQQIAQSPDLTNLLVSLNASLKDFRHLSETARTRIGPLADQTSGTLSEAQQTLVELRRDLQAIRDLLGPQAPLRRDLSQALNELSEAARSVSGLADFLTRHPDALLRGRSHQQTIP